jgi:uncharacterized protein YndB with AHSA1/START domain
MVDIRHKVGIDTTDPDAVFAALTTVDGLAGWWTTDTAGDGDVGGTLQFRFANGGFDMQVIEVDPGRRVRWRVVEGPDEWIDTTIDWQLRHDDGETIVLFTHEGWREPVEFMHHCSTKWGTYLLSLKDLVETGTGAPHPDDLKVDRWDSAPAA